MKDSRGRFVQDQRIMKVAARGRHLSVGRLIPENWQHVRVTKTKEDETTVWIRIRKLEISEA